MPGNHLQVSKLEFVDDEDILVTLDGDDWLFGSDVLSRVFMYFPDKFSYDIWSVYSLSF